MEDFIEKKIYKRLSNSNLIGLSFSGGGYRSATFSYGVLKGLHKIGYLENFHYLSCVSGGSWMGMAFSIWNNLDKFFNDKYWENEFTQSLLFNNPDDYKGGDFLSDVFSNRLENTFLEPLKKNKNKLISDEIYFFDKRPFLIVNGTHLINPSKLVDKSKGSQINYPDLALGCTGEVFEMTQFYVWSESLGLCDSKKFKDSKDQPGGLKPKIVLAISGAAPHFSSKILNVNFMAREMQNYNTAAYRSEEIILTDGGQIENLGVKSLLRRNCKKIFIVDSEYDEFNSNGVQAFDAMKKVFAERKELIKKIQSTFNNKEISISRFKDGDLDILYLKLRKNDSLDPGFNPMIKTFDVNYDKRQFEHLKDLGENLIESNKILIQNFFN